MQTRRRNGGSNPASSVSPHYKFSNLNAATHCLEDGSAPSTPNPKKKKRTERLGYKQAFSEEESIFLNLNEELLIDTKQDKENDSLSCAVLHPNQFDFL